MLWVEPFELYSIVTGTIRLDGGAMFGVVPKVLWEKVADVDELNRIQLATRTLLAVDRLQRRVVLVDTGCGTKWAPEQARRYGIQTHPRAITDTLQKISLSAEDVTDIILTHLHFDHNGGVTDWFDEPDGSTVLRYPRARHWIHEAHWQHAHQPYVKDQASFLKRDFIALEQSDRLQLVKGEQPQAPFEGMSWFVSNGHTPCQLHPVFGISAKRLLFVGDVVPTVAHLRLNWVMAYDVRPLTTITEKQTLFRQCYDQGLLLAFPHDPKIGGVQIDGTIERPIVSQTLPLTPE